MATKVNLIIDQGTTFSKSIDLKDANNNPLDVTDYESRGQLRKHYLSSNSISFSTSLTEGQLTISLTANQTSSIVSGRHVYDVELINPSGSISRIMEGIITVTPEVTK